MTMDYLPFYSKACPSAHCLVSAQCQLGLDLCMCELAATNTEYNGAFLSEI